MANCSTCDNSGLVHMVHKDNKCKYVFKCDCLIGQTRNAIFPQWKSIFLSQYEKEVIIEDSNVVVGSFGAKKNDPDQSKEDEDFSLI